MPGIVISITILVVVVIYAVHKYIEFADYGATSHTMTNEPIEDYNKYKKESWRKIDFPTWLTMVDGIMESIKHILRRSSR